jgi:protein TonB
MTVNGFGPEQDNDTALWMMGAFVVVALHVGLAVAYLWLRPAPPPQAEAPAFDVVFTPTVNAPVPMVPEAPPEPLPAEPTPPVEQSNLEPPKDEPVVTREAVAEPEPVVKVEPMPEPPPPAVALTAPEPSEPVTLAPPPKPAEAVPQPDKPVVAPAPAARKPVREGKTETHRAPPKPVAAPSARPARVAAAPNQGAESEGAREGQASWNRQVEAQIGRAASYPADGGGASGTALVSVVIDRNGSLRSHRLTRSSGSPALDRAAMAIIERAAPFPRFPSGMTVAQVSRTVPMHLRQR